MLAVVPLQLRAADPSSAGHRRRRALAGSHRGDRGPLRDPRSSGRAGLSRGDPGSQPPPAPRRRVGPAGDSRPAWPISSPRLSRAATLTEPAILTLERVLARFEPIRDWRVIGPFPRTTPSSSSASPAINFGRAHPGALGRSVSWASRQADPATGRVDLSDFKHGAGDQGGFGYDGNGSPDLGAFAYTEVEADRAGPALLLDRLERHADRDRQRKARLSIQQYRRQGIRLRHRSGAARAGKGTEPDPGRLPARDRALVFRAPDRAGRPACRSPWSGRDIARRPAPIRAGARGRSREGRSDLLRHEGGRLCPMPRRGRARNRRRSAPT